jgi:hypothetical protein
MMNAIIKIKKSTDYSFFIFIQYAIK